MVRRLPRLVLASTLVAHVCGAGAGAGLARAQVNGPIDELEGIGIDDKPGTLLPLDLAFTDQDGLPVTLADYFGPTAAGGAKPTVLVLAYYQCPMLCSLVQNGLVDGLRRLAWTAGDKFRVVVASIDPRDTPAAAAAKRNDMLAKYGRPLPDGAGSNGSRGFDFLVADGRVSRRLADTVGFHYRWDDKQQQFAHAAAAFIVTGDGKLSRTLYGISFPDSALRLALVEASAGRFGSAWDKLILFCYHYDPAARSYVLTAMRVMRIGGLLTVAGIVAFVLLMTRRKGHAVEQAA